MSRAMAGTPYRSERARRRREGRRADTELRADEPTPSVRQFVKVFAGLVVIGGALLAIVFANAPAVHQPLRDADALKQARFARHVASWRAYRDRECMPVPLEASAAGARPRIVWACANDAMFEEGPGGVPANWTGVPPAPAGEVLQGLVPVGAL